MKQEFKNFDFLDSYRGLAAISVAFSHAIFHLGDFPIMDGFYFGVISFYLLSAFLLTYRLVIQYDSAGFDIRFIIRITINYFITRFFRIYVTYVIFCFIYGVLEYLIFGDTDQVKILIGAVLLNKDYILSNNNRHGHLWTIPTEVKLFKDSSVSSN